VVSFAVVVVVIVMLAGSSLAGLQQGFYRLLVLEGVDGNSRLDLWEGTLRLWWRAPLVGAGLGAYRHAIALDRPATGSAVLEQAHNDWLEWLATSGLVGALVLALMVAGMAPFLRLKKVRRLRFELRYPIAGLMTVLIATALHEAIGFGLQTPLNRYLAAMWIGLFWGVASSLRTRRSSASRRLDSEPGKEEHR
jgi:O-antigen ligase